MLKRLVLSDISFLTTQEKILLWRHPPFFGAGETEFLELFLNLSTDDISVIAGRTFRNVVWRPFERIQNARRALAVMSSFGIGCTCIDCCDFPAMLREMSDPPYMIFYRGALSVLERTCISVVGTRRCTESARRAATEFASAACDDGCCVVSGLAFGIDAAAHRGAILSEHPATVAVLPCGVDTVVPRTNSTIAVQVLGRGGLLLSEYLPGTPAALFRYVQRNRIIAALSASSVIIQSPPGSGAMITAEFALDYNRNVVFHSQCFSEDSRRLGQFSERELKKQLAQGKKVEYKLNNTPERFVHDGAPVVSDYDEFKRTVYADSYEFHNAGLCD